MSDDKVYNPEEIEDSPFPNEDTIEGFDVSQSTSGDKINAQQIKDQKMPSRRIAQELIGTALNTKSQKILKEFEFTDSGAIKVGEYENGVSGDLKISPNGLVARNDAGTTTFAIDGTSGDAVFKGTVQAGSVISGIIQSDSVISGDVTVGGDDNANGSIAVLDENNVEKITLDKDGMTINDGKLTVKDEDNTTILNSEGLVSTAVFGSEESSQASGVFDAGDFWDLEITKAFSKNTVCMLFYNVQLLGSVQTTNISLTTNFKLYKPSSAVPMSLGIGAGNVTTSGEGVTISDHYAFTANEVGTYRFLVEIDSSGVGKAVMSGRLSLVILGN